MSLVAVRPNRIACLLAVVIVSLVALSLSAQALHLGGRGVTEGMVRWVNVDDELNVPTAYQALTLLAAASLLLLIGDARRRERATDATAWFGLAAIFGLLAADEVFQLHEKLKAPLLFLRSYSPALRYGWVAVGLPFALLVGLLYARFLFRLPRATAARFVLAGALFVGGAVGMEMAAGALSDALGRDNLRWVMLGTFEEAMEMSGVALFIVALLRHARTLPAAGFNHAPIERTRRYAAYESYPGADDREHVDFDAEHDVHEAAA